MLALSLKHRMLAFASTATATAIDLNLKFSRYFDNNCTHADRIHGWDKLENPDCKTWGDHATFHSYSYGFAAHRPDNKVPPGAKYCRALFYEQEHCRGEYGTVDNAFDMLGYCNVIDSSGGGKSIKVMCD